MMDKTFKEEWIVTNALGGYASGSVCGANTRSYHGLLVAALNPPTDRKIYVAKVEERVLVNGVYYDLSSNQYPGVVYPKGFQYLKNFNINPIPCWLFEGENWKVEKSVCMVQQSNTTLINYVNRGTETIQLELHPLYEFADLHNTFHENPNTNFSSEFKEKEVKTYPIYEGKPIYTSWSLGKFIENKCWYRHIQLPVEAFRGLDSSCDYYQIGILNVELKPNEEVILSFSLDETINTETLNNLFISEKERLDSSSEKGFYRDLIASGNQFIVDRKSTNSVSIIAGYHWFTDWGRDTMISMGGLTISTGNQTVSNSILSTFLGNINQGMIPNRFPDNSNDIVEYNTIDATLWMFVALYDYFKKFNDFDFITEHLKTLQDVLNWHIKGTRYNIHVTPEGFLYGGQEGKQLTWMDAMVNGEVVTPRMGCPVEINALWYNALKIHEFFCETLNVEIDEKFLEIVHQFESNFSHYFLKADGTLNDVVNPNVFSDDSFRCNQIYCLSLPFSVLNKEQEKRVFEGVKEKLWTPYGLRTLNSDDPSFVETYQGNQWQRDHAYHQGTIWPFLLQPYYEAFFKIYGISEENRKQVIDELKIIKNHFYNSEGIHCISEVFDGKNPLQGKGTIQQAWSVAALIKLYTDYKLYELDEE